LGGFASSGIHSNGYSLVRNIVFDQRHYQLDQIIDGFEDLGPIGQELLTPTKIYAKAVAAVSGGIEIHGMAHVTGGGFIENLPRMMPEGLGAEIELGSWPVLRIFDLLKEKGSLADRDLYSVFNMGIGFVLAVAQEDVEKVLEIASASGEQAYQIGRVSETPGVQFQGEQDGSLNEK
jgi:phosphoribosylformylglycinamidine cyclo-ligase